MASRHSEVLLTGEFQRIVKRRPICTLTLTKHSLNYSPKDNPDNAIEPVQIQTSDIIGCRCEKPQQKTSESDLNPSTWLSIVAYPFRKKVFSSKRVRQKVKVTFEINNSDDFEDNSKLAEKWMHVINCLSRNIPVSLEDVERCVCPVRKKMLILINPNSGSGKALTIFKQDILPMLLEANIPHKMTVTEYGGHAGEMMKTLIVEHWYGIIIISGDGLIYEVINGLMSRDDWQTAIKLPIGCLPGGSGNALCCSINYAAGEPVLHDLILHSTFIMIKHCVIPMDLVLIQTPSQNIYSFLSVTWGLIADIDFESEKYRSIGEARFAVGAVKRIMGLRNYKARLCFLPVAEYVPKTDTGADKSNQLLKKIRRFSLRSRSNSYSTMSSQDDLGSQRSSQSSPVNENQDQKVINGSAVTSDPELQNINDSEVNDRSISEVNLNQNNESYMQNHDVNENLNNTHKLKSQIACLNIECNDTKNQKSSILKRETDILTATNNDIEIEHEVLVATKHDGNPIPSPLLAPLDQAPPDNWVVIEDEFVTVAAMYQTHLGSDMFAAPEAHINDGFIYLMFIRQGISRSALFNLFMSFGEGKHVDSPYVEMIRCLAFRLEPLSPGSTIMIDGERSDPCPIQGQVLPGLSRLMAIK